MISLSSRAECRLISCISSFSFFMLFFWAFPNYDTNEAWISSSFEIWDSAVCSPSISITWFFSSSNSWFSTKVIQLWVAAEVLRVSIYSSFKPAYILSRIVLFGHADPFLIHAITLCLTLYDSISGNFFAKDSLNSLSSPFSLEAGLFWPS